ncbi:hypothetical protein ACQT30_21330, partial [Klebsiella pneumoniae]
MPPPPFTPARSSAVDQILLLILALCPVYSWAACTGTNYDDVSMTNLPEKILVNAGSYT